MLKLKTDVQSIWVLKNPWKQTSFIRTDGRRNPKQLRINLKDVRYCTSRNVEKHYIKLVTIDGEEYFKLTTLDTIASCSNFLIRIQKDTIVNALLINKRYDWLHVWSDNMEWKVSPAYREGLVESINRITF